MKPKLIIQIYDGMIYSIFCDVDLDVRVCDLDAARVDGVMSVRWTVEPLADGPDLD